jgi:hypothetical protein
MEVVASEVTTAVETGEAEKAKMVDIFHRSTRWEILEMVEAEADWEGAATAKTVDIFHRSTRWEILEMAEGEVD